MGSSSASAFLTGLIATVFSALSAVSVQAETCRPDLIELRGAGNEARLSVEVADSDLERAHGLMFREALADDAGMLFVYPAPRHVGFWMKNTLIPLDMVFANAAGQVLRVHENAVPLDETVIDGGPDVQFVLEVAAGRAAAMGVAPGTQMRHPAITDGAWPCD